MGIARALLLVLIALVVLSLHCEAFSPRAVLQGRRITRALANQNDIEPMGNDAQLSADEKEMLEEEKRRSYSSSMKDKLRREAEALGGDPNVKSANPIAIIAAVVAVLALASFGTGALQ
jgi:hypothetical protein